MRGDAAAVLAQVDGSVDAVAQGVEGAVDAPAGPAAAAHRDHGHGVTRLGPVADMIGVVALVPEKRRRRGQVIARHQVEACVVRDLPGRDVDPHGQAPCARAEVDLGRGATPGATDTGARRALRAPAAC